MRRSLEPDIAGQQIAYKAWAHVQAENKWKELEEKLTTTNEQLRIAREALEDFATHGTRCDTNPAGIFHDCGHFDLLVTPGEVGWLPYLQRADKHVRDTAREALAKISEGEK